MMKAVSLFVAVVVMGGVVNAADPTEVDHEQFLPFDKIDRDSNGEVTKVETHDFMLSQWEELEAHVEKYSTHADMKQVAEDMIAKVVGLYEEGDANNDGVMTREEHAALISQKSHSISGVMMELQTKFMLLMAEGRDQGEM